MTWLPFEKFLFLFNEHRKSLDGIKKIKKSLDGITGRVNFWLNKLILTGRGGRGV